MIEKWVEILAEANRNFDWLDFQLKFGLIEFEILTSLICSWNFDHLIIFSESNIIRLSFRGFEIYRLCFV